MINRTMFIHCQPQFSALRVIGWQWMDLMTLFKCQKFFIVFPIVAPDGRREMSPFIGDN